MPVNTRNLSDVGYQEDIFGPRSQIGNRWVEPQVEPYLNKEGTTKLVAPRIESGLVNYLTKQVRIMFPHAFRVAKNALSSPLFTIKCCSEYMFCVFLFETN